MTLGLSELHGLISVNPLLSTQKLIAAEIENCG